MNDERNGGAGTPGDAGLRDPGARRRIMMGAGALLLLTVFAVAFILGRLDLRDANRQVADLEEEVRLLHAHRTLGMAAYEAGRSNYANASAATTRFYEGLNELLQSDSGLSPEARAILLRIQEQRDTITAQIAVADPNAARSLADAYLAMNSVVQERRRDRQEREAPPPA